MATCPSCKTSYSGAARLCRNCGKPVPPADVIAEPSHGPVNVAANELRVCPRCGRVVPTMHKACGACGPSPPAPVSVVRRVDDAYWAHLSFEWPCVGCGRVSITSFANDGRAQCPKCGAARDLAPVLWRIALRHAHAVADLAGPDDEGGVRGRPAIGAFNPHNKIGVESTEAEGDRMRPADDVPSKLFAGPGHPICGCGALVEPAWRGGDHVCACGAKYSSEVPAPFRRVMMRSIAAVIAPHAVEVTTRGVIALVCPSCHAPLDAPSGTNRAMCKYCGTFVAIAVQGAMAERAGAAPPPMIWVLFRGPSAARTDYERNTSLG